VLLVAAAVDDDLESLEPHEVVAAPRRGRWTAAARIVDLVFFMDRGGQR
jgi:hypothetical protein